MMLFACVHELIVICSVICACRDVHTGEKVAIKRISDAFSKPAEAIRTLREIKLLRYFKVCRGRPPHSVFMSRDMRTLLA